MAPRAKGAFVSLVGLKRRQRRPPLWLTRHEARRPVGLAGLRPERQRRKWISPSAQRAASANARRAAWRVPLTKMVGLGRLELPTSRLSSARSNQLSYKPGARDRPSADQDRDPHQRRPVFLQKTSSVQKKRLIRKERETRTAKSRKKSLTGTYVFQVLR